MPEITVTPTDAAYPQGDNITLICDARLEARDALIADLEAYLPDALNATVRRRRSPEFGSSEIVIWGRPPNSASSVNSAPLEVRVFPGSDGGRRGQRAKLALRRVLESWLDLWVDTHAELCKRAKINKIELVVGWLDTVGVGGDSAGQRFTWGDDESMSFTHQALLWFAGAGFGAFGIAVVQAFRSRRP